MSLRRMVDLYDGHLRVVSEPGVFSTSRKAAQQTAQKLISGHCTLVAWWSLRHAGVFDAMEKMEEENGEGLDPLVYATRTNMSHEVLGALLDYLAATGLISMKGGQARLTTEGRSLFVHGDSVLEMIRGYEPVLAMSEHLLARLKSVSTTGTGIGGVARKSEYLVEAQAQRHALEVFPAVTQLLAHHKLAHILDIACGTGELLIHLAQKLKRAVGVGLGSDPFAVRKANGRMSDLGLDKRLIAVTANPVEAVMETQRTFERIGISRQLWHQLDCIVATGVFSELAAGRADNEGVTAVAEALAATRKHFPKARIVIVETVDSPRFEKNFYAAEMSLLMRMTRSMPWPSETWREAMGQARLELEEEKDLKTDGVTIFMCK